MAASRDRRRNQPPWHDTGKIGDGRVSLTVAAAAAGVPGGGPDAVVAVRVEAAAALARERPGLDPAGAAVQRVHALAAVEQPAVVAARALAIEPAGAAAAVRGTAVLRAPCDRRVGGRRVGGRRLGRLVLGLARGLAAPVGVDRLDVAVAADRARAVDRVLEEGAEDARPALQVWRGVETRSKWGWGMSRLGVEPVGG